MRRAWLLVVSLLIIPSAQEADAAPTLKTIKPGSTCSKLNQIQIINSWRFTCVKSGKKLIWNKGIAIKPPSKSSQIVNNFIDQYADVQVTWDNLNDQKDLLVLKNWANWQKAQTRQKKTLIKREILYSPNVVVRDIEPNKVFDNLEKIFSWVNLPDQYRVLYFGIKDEEWAKNKYKELYSSKNEVNFAACRKTFCIGGNVGREPQQMIHMNISRDYELAPAGLLSNSDPEGGLEAHEFIHVIQFGYAKGYRDLAVPAWITEGGATFFSTLALAKDLDSYRYMRYRSSQSYRYAPENIEKHVLDLFNGSPDSPFSANYTLGYFVTEVLTGMYGIDGTFRLIENTSNLATFEEAFKVTFGEDWLTVKPRLVSAVKHQILLPRGF